MQRTTKYLSAILLLIGGCLQIGCQACGSPYDYSPPVADCQCGACDCSGGRSGSVSTGSAYYAGPDQAPEEISRIAEQPKKSSTR